jgi:hypothetical protein
LSIAAQYLEVSTQLLYNLGVPSARQSVAKPAIINATARTRSAIEGLQARLNPQELNQQDPAPESEDDLERELQTYFENNGVRNELRSHVIEGVVDKILAEWPGLGQEVVDRLVERVANELRKTTAPTP